MNSLIRSRLVAARHLLFLIERAGLPTVSLTVAVHFLAGLMIPLVILGSGFVVTGATGRASVLVLGVVLCAVGLLGQQVAAPAQIALTSSVSIRIDAYCSRRLIDAIGEASNLRAVEEPEIIEQVSDATTSLDVRGETPGAAAAGALALFARYTTLIATVVLLAVVVSLPVAALGLAVGLMNRFGQTYAFSIWSATWRRFNPARRRMLYLRGLVTDPLIARDVRMLQLAPWIEKRSRAEARLYLRPLWWSRRRVYGSAFVFYALATVVGSSTLIAVAITALSTRGVVTLGSIAIVLQASALCVMFGTTFPESDTQMQYGRAAWQSILNIETALKTGPRSTRRGASKVADPAPPRSDDLVGPAEIEFSDVVYGYTSGVDVLRGASLKLAAGRSTALVGINGAGKSTLVKLLAGFYEPSSGSVLLDGVALDATRRLCWQKRIAIVFQDYLRYQVTLRQNIAMQASEMVDDDAGMIRCLVDVGLGDAFHALPLALDTPLSRLLAGGTDLSGGQWQRLALARALYAVRHGARALVLDEPTSQMDARGEAEFFSNFVDLTRGITSLVISHRFSSVRQADTIAVLDGGVVTELGSHHDLVRQGGAYARMYAAQSSRYALE